MNTLEKTNTYACNAFKCKLYSSLDERNSLFGYGFMQQSPLQQRYHDNYFYNSEVGTVGDVRTAPKDYYFDMKVPACEKTVIGPLNTRPNLYNDNVLPYTTTFERPNLRKNWKPFTTTAVPAMTGQYVRFIPHKPCEVAPTSNPNYWVADLNAKIYERGLISGAREQPYANWYRRQGLVGLLAQNMPSGNDPYTKKIKSPADTFCKLKGPPAVTSF